MLTKAVTERDRTIEDLEAKLSQASMWVFFL
jgi:hypothetical protein